MHVHIIMLYMAFIHIIFIYKMIFCFIVLEIKSRPQYIRQTYRITHKNTESTFCKYRCKFSYSVLCCTLFVYAMHSHTK